MTYFSRHVSLPLEEAFMEVLHRGIVPVLRDRQSELRLKSVFIFVPVLLTLLNARYLINIFNEQDVNLNISVSFQPRNTNFTMPLFKICLSHVFQLNLLTDPERYFLFNQSKRHEGNSQSRRWWPEVSDVVLKIRSLIGKDIPSRDLFFKSKPDLFQTCMQMYDNVTFHAAFPGAWQGVELVLNLQAYEEIPILQSPHFTLLSIIPFMKDELEPDEHNKIHISPGRFASVSSEMIIHDSTVRKLTDIKCEQGIKQTTVESTISSGTISPVSYYWKISGVPSRGHAEKCVKYQHRTLVTEAKLKYTKNLTSARIDPTDMKMMELRLRSAMKLRSKFDPMYRNPLVRHLRRFAAVNKNIGRCLDLMYAIDCDDVDVELKQIRTTPNLPTMRSQMYELMEYNHRFYLQVLKTLHYGRNRMTIAVSKLFQHQNMNLFSKMMQDMQAHLRQTAMPNSIVSSKTNIVIDIFGAVAMQLNTLYRHMERILQYGSTLTTFFSMMTFNDYLRSQSLNSTAGGILRLTDSVNSDINETFKCLDSGLGRQARTPFTNRRKDSLFVVVNNSYIKDISDGKTVYQYRHHQHINIRHLPNAQLVNIPFHVNVHCLALNFFQLLIPFAVERYFDFRNRNARYNVISDYTLFVLNHLTTDHVLYNVNNSLLDDLHGDQSACSVATGSTNVVTTVNLTIDDSLHKQLTEKNFAAKFVVKNVFRLLHMTRECALVARRSKNNLIQFTAGYEADILAPFVQFSHTVSHFGKVFQLLAKKNTENIVNIDKKKMSIQFQLRTLQALMEHVLEGNDESELAHLLDRHGVILMGAMRIQLASLEQRHRNYQREYLIRHQRIRNMAQMMQSLLGTNGYQKAMFDSVFAAFFGDSTDQHSTVQLSSQCLNKIHLKLTRRYLVARKQLSEWLRMIIFLVLRAKRFVSDSIISEKFLKTNIAVVHIFYEDFNVRINTNQLIMTSKQLRSQLGNILNMYLGAGLMNCVELSTLTLAVAMALWRHYGVSKYILKMITHCRNKLHCPMIWNWRHT